MTKNELIKELEKYDDDTVVVCMNEQGGWDNIDLLMYDGSTVAIVFGVGSPFSDEQ